MSDVHATSRPGLKGLDLKPGYDSSDHILETFYVPALSRAVEYSRSVGYFRSSSLSVAARGLSRFINSGGRVRLLCGAEVSQGDREALLGRTEIGPAFAKKLADALVSESEVDRRRLEVLAWLAKVGRLEVRIAIPIDGHGTPIVGGNMDPYFHEKIGVLHDQARDGVAFQGSVNESAQAWTRNFESFSVYPSWTEAANYFSHWKLKFDEHWAGRMAGFKVYPLPQAVTDRLLSMAPDFVPGERDPEEPEPMGDDAVVARYLQVAPTLVGAEALPVATTGITLFPHQQQVVHRLAGLYPRSWLLADEVGLGKTISAGMALRRLLLSKRVRRALILAPANVCRQWQDELFEKFGLWVPRLDGGKIYGVHPDDVRTVAPGQNPWEAAEVLIASSYLARRPVEQERLIANGPYDLIIVDEAHHARRTHIDEQNYRPGRLLELLDRITQRGAAKALWLLTATPMQVDAIELRDLLTHVGLQGPLASPRSFERYFREVGKGDGPKDRKTAWAWLDHTLRDTPRLPSTAAEEAVLQQIRETVGPVDAARIEKFGTGDRDGEEIVKELTPAGRTALRQWLSLLSPVGQFVTRHSRETLKRYRDLGLLTENLADRDTEPVVVPFTDEERALYDELDSLIDRLMAAHGRTRGAGFVLTTYRRRLTSSWAAIQATLTKRLNREELALDDDQAVEDLEGVWGEASLETGDGHRVNDTQALPLTAAEIEDIRGYINRMKQVPDSKFDRLRRDLDYARGRGHSTIVFTQYTDTLISLRDRLVGAYRSQLATFTGDGGRVFREHEGWVDISKRDLVAAVRSGRITVLLANDAASEGLNLQACSFLINYDMPWNPMRVEQRIGRVDRLGQARDVVHIRSYFVPDTVEQDIYTALAGRIDNFRQLLGNLQPILGATERAFQTIFQAPKSERAAVQRDTIRALVDKIDCVRQDGVDFEAEDPMPLPEQLPAPVTLEDLREVLVERYAAALDGSDRPVTFDPARASRDAETWTALATYGHPALAQILSARAASFASDDSALVITGDGAWPTVAVRADRTPPVPVQTLREVDTLGTATAHGQAYEEANNRRTEAADEQRHYEDALYSTRRQQVLERLRMKFVNLVHDALALGCAAARYEGGANVDPITIWLKLKEERTSQWAYVEAMRGKLGVQMGALIPARLSSQREPISPDEWDELRRELAVELGMLMKSFKAASSTR
ncbi:phospholipase D-like protein [Streptomyces sp. 3212.3]|uniref:DEAD/DEAH box helicase n=1 Tax=Streptomyces sp. 3212.3 TaxID=1938846 RepID=UPI000E256DD7|nr:helicase-related protein [Streptomyces sp. 3212.3]REE63399.1 phospholipase D-like protein [Streptomyces sp. 3212.3]